MNREFKKGLEEYYTYMTFIPRKGLRVTIKVSGLICNILIFKMRIGTFAFCAIKNYLKIKNSLFLLLSHSEILSFRMINYS